MGTLGQKLDYLTDTKSILKQKINNLGGSLTDQSTFRSYGNYLDELYDEMPKVTGEGTEITLSPTRKGKMNIGLKGNTSQDSLPTGYTALDYIESTGTQYIDTGINADSTLKAEMDMQYVDQTTAIASIGALYDNGTGNYIRYHWGNSGSKNRFYYDTTYVQTNNRDTDRHYLIADIPNGKTYVDTKEYSFQTVTFNISLNFWLFGRNSNTEELKSKGKMKIWSSKLYKSGVLVRDFIPCKNPNNEVGLYDLVSQTFFGNAGTGDFVAGNEVPNPDYPQDIHVVTGNNTISIGNTNYPINLGSLELCKIGDYQDYLYKDSDKWYLHKETHKHTLTGVENWAMSYGEGLFNCSYGSFMPTKKANSPIAYSNYFVFDKRESGMTSIGNNKFAVQGNYTGLFFRNNSITSASDFKTWLSTHNTNIYYVLAEATNTQITDETLISQLDAIENAMSTTGTTTITQTNSDLPFIITASALKPFTTETLTTSLTDGE